MTKTGTRIVQVVALALAVSMLVPSEAAAYIGPGAGLSAFGALIALVGAIIVGIFGFIWYPIKRVIRMLKAKSAPQVPVEAQKQ